MTPTRRPHRSKEKYRVRVMCGWWERAYTFEVEGDVAVAVDGWGFKYDVPTLKANAREKGGYWKPLSQGRERER